MVERVLEYTAEFQFAFQIEKERLVVFRPTDSIRQYLIGSDTELLGQLGDTVFGGTQAVACEFGFHR